MLTKQCRGCKNIYEVSAFHKDLSRRDGLSRICKTCKRIKSDKENEHGRQRAIKAKLDYGKCDCHGIVVTIENLHQFQWDHIDPQNKKYVIGKIQKQSDKVFFEELAKCRLVCTSFHKTHTRSQWLQGLIGTNTTSIDSLLIQKPAHQESLFEGM
jgi:hypothetical protein